MTDGSTAGCLANPPYMKAEPMRVEDFNKRIEVVSEEELGSAMSQRYVDSSNLFWLSHQPEGYPVLAIHVKGDLAVLNYFPEERQAGFVSIGSVSSLEPREFTIFSSSSTGETDMIPNHQIVPFAAAIEAAKEFMRSDTLPTSIKWFEL
jgi:Immunity protein Imm1